MSVRITKTTSSGRRVLQHQRWFRNEQKWRTGSESPNSGLKRRHGLRGCLYPGLDGMRRWPTKNQKVGDTCHCQLVVIAEGSCVFGLLEIFCDCFLNLLGVHSVSLGIIHRALPRSFQGQQRGNCNSSPFQMRTLRYSLRRVSPLDSVNGGTWWYS